MAHSIDDFNRRRLRSSNITVVVSISLVLFLVGLFGLILINAQKYSDYIKEQLVVAVYFDEYLDPKDSAKAGEYQQETYKLISGQKYVKKTKFITKEEAKIIAKKQLGIDTEEVFGKNILNILPFYLGGILYSVYTSTDFSEHLISIAFSSALAPFISSVAFYGEVAYETSYINAILIGVLIGFIVVPLAKSLYDFHEGYDLYNLGFTAGILGSVIMAVLKLYHFEINPQFLVSSEYDMALKIICSSVFVAFIIVGFYINNNSFSGYFKLIRDDGYKSDFTKKYGYALTYINMGMMGLISVAFVTFTGQTFNGPILAGLFTVVGFSANGKTIFNTIPIFIGVLLASFGSKGSMFTVAISGLFGTALAPISGVFGPVAGIIAGWLHLAVVQNVGLVHGGLNLYNNGFSAGIVAGFLLPVFNMITDNNNQRKMNIQKKHMNFLKAVQKNIKNKMKEEEGEDK